MDGPRLRHVRRPAFERRPPPPARFGLGAARTGRHRCRPRPAPLRNRPDTHRHRRPRKDPTTKPLAEAAKRHAGRLNLGILTNVAGLDSRGQRTIDLIATDATKAVPAIHLTTLFAAEHGLSAKQETTAIKAEFDSATNLPITSLYGPKPGDRRPTHSQLKDLDAVVIDLQDVGNRFWTFDTAMAYFLEASAEERRVYEHDLEIIVLDHPNPSSGTDFAVQGPVSDGGRQSYIDYTPLPARHGMTIGELARYYNGEATATAQPTRDLRRRNHSPQGRTVEPQRDSKHISPSSPWNTGTRSQYLDTTGIPWTPPSPNLRSLTAATLYPGVGLFETTNLSVGRGTDTSFEHFGAPYLKPDDMLACLSLAKHPRRHLHSDDPSSSSRRPTTTRTTARPSPAFTSSSPTAPSSMSPRWQWRS